MSIKLPTGSQAITSQELEHAGLASGSICRTSLIVALFLSASSLRSFLIRLLYSFFVSSLSDWLSDTKVEWINVANMSSAVWNKSLKMKFDVEKIFSHFF